MPEPLPTKFWLLLPQRIELDICKLDPKKRIPPVPPLPRALDKVLFATVTFVSVAVEFCTPMPAPMLWVVLPSMRQWSMVTLLSDTSIPPPFTATFPVRRHDCTVMFVDPTRL